MKPYWTGKVLGLGLSAVMACAMGCSGVGPQPPDAQQPSGAVPFSNTGSATIAKGTSIYVRLQQSISSATAEPGQSFSAVLDEPLIVDGRIVAHEGAAAGGRVVAVRKSRHLHDSGYLRVALFFLTIDDKIVPIETSSVFVEGGSYKNHNLAYLGGAAESSGFMGGSRGALIGSAIGASPGVNAAYVTSKQEVGLAAERRIGFRLIEPVNISSSAPGN